MLTCSTTACGSDLAGLSLDELEDELAELSAHLSAGMCHWLELVAELDRRGSWAESGCLSCAAWLAWRCSLTPRAAREHVRVARRLSGLPLIHAAFGRGELSYAKVRALTRVAERENEGELLELAFALTAAQLERTVRAYRRVSTREALEVHERAELSWYWDEDGSLVMRARLAPEDGALVLRALEVARERLWQRDREAEGGSAEPPEREHKRGSAEPPSQPRRPTNIEALVAVADAALFSDDGRTGGERYTVVVHVDEGALAQDEAPGVALEEGPAVAAETARRIACDASIVQVSERQGKPLSVGRRTRTIPPVMRRALMLRDGGCRFPGCENRLADAHHIHHWALGGKTAFDNLVLLCRRHHRLVHEGGYAVDERMRFYDPRGRPIRSVPRRPPGGVDELLETTSSLVITPRTCKHGHGDRLDLELTIAALCQIAGGSPASVAQPP